LSDSLYHSGLTADPQQVIRELIELDRLPSIAIVGYSLGGNVGLKLAGDYGAEAPPELRSICAVSPTMDLARCVDALERPRNTLYEWNFVRNLKRRMQRKARVTPGAFDLRALRGVSTVRGFDEAYTAPHHGFRDASDYYHSASSLRVVDRISVPTLILTADDDPFVPADQFQDAALGQNPNISVTVTRGGGHCGFYAEPTAGFDGYWAEQTAVSFSKDHAVPGRRG
jgi:predicted alpha/beta-fold hydrolase